MKLFRRDRPRIFHWAYPYGDYHDPWPGDLSMCLHPTLLVFDGRYWQVVK